MKPQTIRIHPARGKSTDPIGVIEPPLTKRERFAMASMQGLCANPHYAADKHFDEEVAAEWACNHADALIEELKHWKDKP
jgi:hypothetical protein